MRKIERLRHEALAACRFHGHDMKRFTYEGRWGYSHCRICNKQVCIMIRPLPNDIEIGGEAVALGCDDPSRLNTDGTLK